jgi:hypothetical protein
VSRSRPRGAALILLICIAGVAPAETIVIGSMHEVLGQGRTEGRAGLAEIAARDHVYAVGAAAGLAGEVTIIDSQVLVTVVGPDGRLAPSPQAAPQAAMLFGGTVPAWSAPQALAGTDPDHVGAAVRAVADEQGLAADRPFVFVIEGELTDVKLHVIAGACPVHARRSGIELPAESRPYEAHHASLSGVVVGLHAAGAAGRLTHPGLDHHAHVVFEDPDTGRLLTGHLERFGVGDGAVLRVPERVAGEP